MASFVEAELGPEERITYRGAVSWVIYLMPVTMAGFGFAWAATGDSVSMRGGLALALVGAIGAVAAYLRQLTSEFAVTTDRVIVKTGVLSRKTIEIKLSKVESIQVDQDIVGRALNYGTMTVVGTGGTKEPFAMIDDPLQFRRAVQSAQA